MIDPKPDIKKDMTELTRILQQKPEICSTVLSIVKALMEVQYGEINIKMQAGKAVWVDSIKRERVG